MSASLVLVNSLTSTRPLLARRPFWRSRLTAWVSWVLESTRTATLSLFAPSRAADRGLDPSRVQAGAAGGLGGVAEDVQVDQIARSFDQQGVLADEQRLGHLDAHRSEQRKRCVGVGLEDVSRDLGADLVLVDHGADALQVLG